ncbi:3-oxoacyl-[acyl-carrier-protein] synthase, KASII [hydrothermal vent metagenome]|uniref:3-oxoacyl-[acyl-carrier-protein] synthase, KASII n=1 Tax=hydrothermal vent metagenome TaxID=652676 RepID=A0A3B1DZT7_9ZZZZ
MNDRVAISAMGCISAAGKNIMETLHSFEKEMSAPSAVSLFDTALKHPVFEVHNFSSKHKNRTLGLLLCALEEALEKYDLEALSSKYKVGVCIGTTVASQLNSIEFYKDYREKGHASMAPVDAYLQGNLAEAIARIYNLKGPCCVVVNACSSGADAIGVASSWLENGFCDIAIAGGADELNKIPLCGFHSLGIMSAVQCAPFDQNRKGLNLGEGAGVMILENQNVYSKRKNSPDMFIAGYGSASDAYHLTAPHPEGKGLEAAINEALLRAKIYSKDICFVNAHGTATSENDKVEGKVLNRIFGDKVNFISTKGCTGHTLGAAGAIEAVFTALTLREGKIPASFGFVKEDPDIGISPVTKTTDINGRFAISTSLAFGGNNAAVVIGKKE